MFHHLNIRRKLQNFTANTISDGNISQALALYFLDKEHGPRTPCAYSCDDLLIDMFTTSCQRCAEDRHYLSP